MRIYLSSVLVLLLFLAAGCDGDPNPTSAIHDTIWVLDSGDLEKPRSFIGRVQLKHNCELEANFSGVEVTFGPTGATTLTDDSGYYAFRDVGKIEINFYPKVTFKKEGYYTVIPNETGFDNGSNSYVVNGTLFKYTEYGAKFIGEPEIKSYVYPIWKDTVVLNADSVLVRTQVVADSGRTKGYTFKAVALNEDGQKTSLARLFLLVSRERNYDHFDRRFLLVEPQGDWSGGSKSFFSEDLVRAGILSGDTIYVSVTSASDCTQGYTPGNQRSAPIRLIIE
jgi:hypothetical protein